VERVAAESGEEESSVVGQSGPEPSGFKDIKLLLLSLKLWTNTLKPFQPYCLFT
jgi:hypothetical protein